MNLDAAINTTSNDQISGISASYCCETGCTPKELESFCEGIFFFNAKVNYLFTNFILFSQ